jgi:AraC-like DNA-binding protein
MMLPLPWITHCQLPASFVRRLLDGKMIVADSPNLAADTFFFHRWLGDLRQEDPLRWNVTKGEIAMRLHRLALDDTARGPAKDDHPEPHDDSVKMVRFVAEHFHEPLTIADIADAAGISADRAGRIFRRVWHMSPIAFVTRHRLAEAQRLLAITDAKIIDVALQSGFGSVSQFYAEFQKAFGQTPRHYRQSFKPSASVTVKANNMARADNRDGADAEVPYSGKDSTNDTQ